MKHLFITLFLLPFLCTAAPQTAGNGFKAVSLTSPSESTLAPPDTTGDVGPAQILVAANGRIKVFDRAGAEGPLNVTLDAFFNSVRNGQGTRGPRVRYDRLSGRWFVVAHNTPVSGPNRILIAVSSSSSITGTNSFNFHQFQQDIGGSPGEMNGLAGALSLGVDANAIYLGASVSNQNATVFQGSAGFVIKKSSLLTGSLEVTPFRLLATGSVSGPLFPQGVHNDDPAATEGYFIGVDSLMFNTLSLVRISDPGGSPALAAKLSVAVSATTYPDLVPHLGAAGNRRLTALDDRLFGAMIKKNKLTGVSSLWTAHNIEVNQAGGASTSGGRDASRWYQLGNLTGTPGAMQTGTLFDPASINPRYFWIPTIAMTGQGHAALGCNLASVNHYPSIAVAGRLASDPSGSLQAFTVPQDGQAAYLLEAVDGQRWGSYSQTVVDPNDDMTLWTFQEYCDAANSWGIRVIPLLAPPPATPISCTPSNFDSGSGSFDVNLTGASSGGSAFFDPGADAGGPGFLNHITASVDGGGVTVNSVTFNGPTNLTLNITVTAAANGGSRTITVTNPDGRSATSAAGLLNITGGALTATIARTNANILIGFNSSAALNYRVVYRNPLGITGWATLIDQIPGTGSDVTVVDPNGASLPSRFYRVEQAATWIHSDVVHSNDDIVVSFSSVIGKTYHVQWRNSLSSPFWTTLQGGLSGTGGTIQVTDTNAATIQPARYYRTEKYD